MRVYLKLEHWMMYEKRGEKWYIKNRRKQEIIFIFIIIIIFSILIHRTIRRKPIKVETKENNNKKNS